MKRNKFRDAFRLSKVVRTTKLKKSGLSFIVFFRPDGYVNSLVNINIESLIVLGFKWVIINVSIKNPNDKRLKKLLAWIKKARMMGLKILVLSNRRKKPLLKNLKTINLEYDAYLSGAIKPFVWKRRKLNKIVGSLQNVFMISNDFLIDTFTANILIIENIVIKENFLHEKPIDIVFNNYQKQAVTYFLKRSNMLNELDSFDVNPNEYDEFL